MENVNDIVSMSRKYENKCIFEKAEGYEKFMYLINHTHLFDDEDGYSNHFFYKCNNYHRNWKTAKEINEMVESMCDTPTPKYTYISSTLGKYVRMGLMEVDKSVSPHRYTLPVDFFETNDLRIHFQK